MKRVFMRAAVLLVAVGAWEFETGDSVYSSPALEDGIVFFGSFDHSVYAVNATTGERRWNFTCGDRVYASPAVHDGLVFIGSFDKKLYALDASTGEEKWNVTTEAWVQSRVAAQGGAVYLGAGDSTVQAFDAATGATLWAFSAGRGVTAGCHSPTVAEGVVYVGCDDGLVYALNAVTGALRWNFTAGFVVRSTPAVRDGIVYVSAADQRDSVVFASVLYALDAETGAERWAFATQEVRGASVSPSSPAVADLDGVGRVVFFGADDSQVYAIDAETGDALWTFATGNAVYSSPTVQDGVVYVGSYDKNLYALDASTGEEKWNVTTGGAVFSSPVVHDSTLYVGSHDGRVYALDATTTDAEEDSDWYGDTFDALGIFIVIVWCCMCSVPVAIIFCLVRCCCRGKCDCPSCGCCSRRPSVTVKGRSPALGADGLPVPVPVSQPAALGQGSLTLPVVQQGAIVVVGRAVATKTVPDADLEKGQAWGA